MHLAQALQVSLHLKLPVLSYILLKRKFIRQASRQCQRALDPHTDWLTRCHCLFVAWLHLKCYCDSDSTKVATIQQPRRWPKTQLPIAGSPDKALIFFFLLNQPLPAVWALETCRVATFRCLREQVSPALEPRGSFSILQSWHRRCPHQAHSSACWTRSPEKKE